MSCCSAGRRASVTMHAHLPPSTEIFTKTCFTGRESNDLCVVQMLHVHKTRQIKNAAQGMSILKGNAEKPPSDSSELCVEGKKEKKKNQQLRRFSSWLP